MSEWCPISENELREIVARELPDCSDELRAYFHSVRFEPAKWQQTPYGDMGNGFWVIAADHNRALWYNDIEDGFNVSEFTTWGVIPDDQYWCNQDQLNYALPALKDGPISQWSPPKPGSFGQT